MSTEWFDDLRAAVASGESALPPAGLAGLEGLRVGVRETLLQYLGPLTDEVLRAVVFGAMVHDQIQAEGDMASREALSALMALLPEPT